MSLVGLLELRPHVPSLLLLLLILLLTGAVTRAEDDQTCEDLQEDNESNKHYACGPRGQVMCQEGWSGDLCNIPKCRQDCHPLHGYCERPGECKCALGWRGKRCERCIPLPGCQNGFCNSTSFECICEEGWGGLFCNQPLCREGCHHTRGYCKSPGECKCRIGWGGETCEECKPLHSCANGYCTKPLECKCHEGWTGLFCQIPICAANCSISHASCTKPGECRCEVGWWGDTCKKCHAYPGCQNGYCTKPWECKCKEGWEGILCDRRSRRKTTFCERNPSACLNGGTCIDVPGNRNFTCSCPSLFTGQRCDYLAESPYTTSAALLTLPTTTTENTTPANVQIVTTDAISPMGNYSLVQKTTITATPRVVSEVRKAYEDPDILTRKIFLQNNARITFSVPKISSAEENSGNEVPLKVIDRKLLPLPVFLSRFHEIIPNKQSKILVFDVGNEQSVAVERNQIGENRRFSQHQEDSPDFILSDLVETERNEKPFPTQQRIIKVNSFNRPFLVSAGATVLPRANPFSTSSLRQPVTSKPKQIDQIKSNEQTNPTTSSIPKITTTTPATNTKITELDVGNEHSIAVERNQISENRRFLRHQEEIPDFILSDLVQAESNEKPYSTQRRLIRINSYNQPFLVSAGATVLRQSNPFSPSTLRQTVKSMPKQTNLIQNSVKYNPTTSSSPKMITTTPATNTKITEFDVGNEQSIKVERNQIVENRRFLRHQEETPDFILSDFVEAESNEKPSTTQWRLIRVNRLSQPFLVNAGDTLLPLANPFSPSTQRQPATEKLKQTDKIKSNAQTNPTTSSIPKITTTMPAINTKNTDLQEEEIFETMETILLPQNNANIHHNGNLEDTNSALQVHHDEYLGGGVHIGSHFAPSENKAFHDAFIELKKL